MNTTYNPDSPEVKACQSHAVGVHTLASSPTNPRKTFDDADMAEMITSVKDHGILQPILVRLWPADYHWTGDMPLYEVVAGERRYRAAKAAGLTIIPAMVRNLTTREVLEIQVIENLQRKDLHPLEEAEGYGLMMKEHGYTAESLAEKIGKSRSYIFARLKLLQLDDDAKRLFRSGTLNPSTALLIARIPTAKLRAKAIKEITDHDYNGDQMSVREAQRHIQNRFMLRLAEASFPIDDSSLCGGSCVACLKRTGNQDKDLFDDVDSPDVCTDPDCFEIKKQAHRDRLAAQAKDAGKEVITGEQARKITGGYVSEYSAEVGKNFVRLDAQCDEDPQKRTYRELLGEAFEETLIEDSNKNRLVSVVKNTVVADKLKEAGIVTYADKRATEQKKAEAKVELERSYRERLFGSVRTEVINFTLDGKVAIPDTIMLMLLRDLVVRYFTRVAYEDASLRILKLWDIPGKNATERKAQFPEFVRQADAGTCWQIIVDLMLAGSLSVNEYSLNHAPEDLETTAKLFSINPDEVRKEVVSERKEQEKSEKQAKKHASGQKKAEKTPDSSTAEVSPPSKAAQAPGIDIVKSAPGDTQYKVGDRVKIVAQDSGVLHSAYGRAGVINEIERDEDGHFYSVRLDTPEGERLEFAYFMTDTAIEPINDATEAAQAVACIGDRVRIKDDAKGPNGIKRKCCGREGVIEAISGEYFTVRFSPSQFPITNLTIGEIEVLPSAGADVIETNTTPSPNSTTGVMYSHPSDSSLAWSGRGRPPKWVNTWLFNGGTMDDLRRVA